MNTNSLTYMITIFVNFCLFITHVLLYLLAFLKLSITANIELTSHIYTLIVFVQVYDTTNLQIADLRVRIKCVICADW